MQTELLTNTTPVVSPDVLFDERVHLTGITEYGVGWHDLVNGEIPLPPQGVRFDIAFEGVFEGPKIRGTIRGVDYLEVRSDGRFMLNIHATLITDDGEAIAMQETGQLLPDAAGRAQLRLAMTCTTSSPAYTWINTLPMWGVGSVDMNTGEVRVQAYAG